MKEVERMRKSKSIFVKDVMCPICNCKGSLQILSITTLNSNRIRHYTKLKDGKPQFEYHKVSKEFVQQILSITKSNAYKNNIDQTQANYDPNSNYHDPKLSNSGLITENNSRDKFHQRVLAFKA
jgi:hypothetical protein